MQEEITKDDATVSVMNVKIHDNNLLGRMNEQGQYILPTAVIEELIKAKKYLDSMVGETIYLSCHLSNVAKDLTILMNYQLINDGQSVIVNFALLEEVMIADGMVTNQLVTNICSSTYEYKEDVLLRAFADFNVYIKDEDSGEEKKLYQEDKTALMDLIVKYNIAVRMITDKQIKKLSNQVCVKQLQFLKSHPCAYTEAVLNEIETGMEIYATLKTLEGKTMEDIQDKDMMDIINNAVEKVDITFEDSEQVSQSVIEEFQNLRKTEFENFKQETKILETTAQEKIIKTATKDDKTNLIEMDNVIKEAENQTEDTTVNLEEYLSQKANDTLQNMKVQQQVRQDALRTQLVADGQQNILQKDKKELTNQEKMVLLSASVSGLVANKKEKTATIVERKAKVDLANRSSYGSEVQVSGKEDVLKKQTTKKEKTKETQKESPKETKKETKKEAKKEAKKDSKKPGKDTKKEKEKDKTTNNSSTVSTGFFDRLSQIYENKASANTQEKQEKPVEKKPSTKARSVEDDNAVIIINAIQENTKDQNLEQNPSRENEENISKEKAIEKKILLMTRKMVEKQRMELHQEANQTTSTPQNHVAITDKSATQSIKVIVDQGKEKEENNIDLSM